jgi:hypothetical protein
VTPPANDEIEVTVLGPGFGESIVIHIGANDWIVVDSCIDSVTCRPASLTYFDQIGIDAASKVKLILATHWHDDHIGGISDLLNACPKADFSCATALAKEEFLQVAWLFNKNAIGAGPSGTSEIQKVFSILKQRRAHPRYAIADRPVFTRMKGTSAACEITALSPCDAEYHRFLAAISALLPRRGITKFRCPDLNPNDLSVAAWVKIEGLDVLLGADLEEHNIAGRGWTAVIASTNRPSGLATVFKVAHHGSVTGHHDGIWSQLLVPSPVAILTPWNRGKSLPTGSDCARITGFTSKAYATSRAVSQRTKHRLSAVVRTLREAEIKVRDAEPPTGYVQLRRTINETDWRITLSPQSLPLSKYQL